MSVPLGLLERFERVAACRHRTLGETQQRIHRLGDIVNRVGMDPEMAGAAYVDEIKKLVATAEVRASRVADLRARRDALLRATNETRSEAQTVLARREAAVLEHEDLVAVLQEVYAVLQEEEGGENASLVQELGSSFQALERSSVRLRDQRNSIRRSRRSVLLQVEEVSDEEESGAEDYYDSDAENQAHGGKSSSPNRSPKRLFGRPWRNRGSSAAPKDQAAGPCPHSPAPLRRPTVYDLPTVPLDLSDDEEDGDTREDADRGVVSAAAAAAAVASTSVLLDGDTTAELSSLEAGPEARPVQLKHLTPEQVEEVYRHRTASRPRKHDLAKHKCPGRRRYCDQCGERMGRGKEHQRCHQCAGHYCDTCERGGIDANCTPMPYWDKRSKKRPGVETGRSLEKDIFLDLQRPMGDKILIPRLVYETIRELDHRVPKMGDSAEGIFRKPGSQEAAKKLACAYAEGRAPWLREEDVDNIATLLKSYLRNLDEPILSFRLYPAFISVARRIPSLTDDGVFDELQRVLCELPPLYFFTTWYLMRLLHRLARHASITKMDEEKLATCLGPTILRAPKTTTELADVAAGLIGRVTAWLIRFPRRRWDDMHSDFLNRSQLAFDISIGPLPKK